MTDLLKIFLPLILLCCLVDSCTSDKVSNQTNKADSTIVKVDVPELLLRSEKTRLGKEWDGVQSLYQSSKQKLSKNDKDHEARLNLAQIFIKEARVTGEHGHYYPSALKVLNQMLADNDLGPDLKFIGLMQKAGVQLSLHEFESALRTGLDAVQLNPNNAQIHGVLVDCYVELGQYEKAVSLADKMINIKPDLRSYSRISYLREIHGDIEGAYKAMKMAAEAGYPGTEETAWTMLTLGEMYALYGEAEKAEKIFEQILVMRDDYPFAIGALAQLDIEKGLYSKAEAQLHKAIDIIPEVGFYVSLAQIYKEQDRQEELDAIMVEIFEMLQDDVNHGHNMNLEYASIHLDILDDPAKALEYLQMEYEKRPENIDVNRQMAKANYAINKIDDSRTFIAMASTTDSKHPELKKLSSLLN